MSRKMHIFEHTAFKSLLYAKIQKLSTFTDHVHVQTSGLGKVEILAHSILGQGMCPGLGLHPQ